MASSACTTSDYRPLINDYALVILNAGEYAIVGPDSSEVVPPTVTALGVVAELIVGSTTHRPLESYFILDTRTNEIEVNLSRDEWFAGLRRRGISVEPKLVGPSRLTNFDRPMTQ